MRGLRPAVIGTRPCHPVVPARCHGRPAVPSSPPGAPPVSGNRESELQERLIDALSSKDFVAVGAVAIKLLLALGAAEDALAAMRDSRDVDAERKRRRRERGGTVSPSIRYAVLKRDGFRCRACGACASDDMTLHVDHVTPVAAGGTSHPSNLRTLCADCNLGKGAGDA